MHDTGIHASVAEGVETITHQGKLICTLVRAEPAPEATTFYTSNELPLQVGKIVYPAGGEIPRHRHPPASRNVVGTPELLVVQKGRVSVDIYADASTFLCTREMGPGDVILLAAGGHGFRFLENTVLLEVKQGPYPGDRGKERF